MAEQNLSGRLVEIESMLDRSRRRFEEGTRLVEDAHKLLADLQQAVIGSPRTISAEDSEEAASRLLASLKASGGEMPETLCGGRLSVDQVQRLIRIDGHPIGITEMEYRVLELLAFARNNVVTRAMLLKHLCRRSDDQPPEGGITHFGAAVADQCVERGTFAVDGNRLADPVCDLRAGSDGDAVLLGSMGDDLDEVAVGEPGLGPGGARDDVAVALDRHARRVDPHRGQQGGDGRAGVGLANLAVDRES